MGDVSIKRSLISRLRRGENIECPECGNAYLTTSAKDISKSHGFSCDECGYAINIDPVIDIE